MNFISESTSVVRSILEHSTDPKPVRYTSTLDYRATQAACVLLVGEEPCTMINQQHLGWMNIFKQFAPKLKPVDANNYTFNWNGVEKSMNCMDGRCNITQFHDKSEDKVSALEIIGAILSGPTGCTTDDPRPFELPVVSFNDRIMFCLNNDNLFKNYPPTWDCLKKNNISPNGISACVFLDALYTVTDANEIELRPESKNISSLNKFLRNGSNSGFMAKFSGTSSLPNGSLGVLSWPMHKVSGNDLPSEVEIFHTSMVWGSERYSSGYGYISLLASLKSSQVYAYLYDDINKCSLLYQAP